MNKGIRLMFMRKSDEKDKTNYAAVTFVMPAEKIAALEFIMKTKGIEDFKEALDTSVLGTIDWEHVFEVGVIPGDECNYLS